MRVKIQKESVGEPEEKREKNMENLPLLCENILEASLSKMFESRIFAILKRRRPGVLGISLS